MKTATKPKSRKQPRLEKAGTYIDPKDVTPISELVRLTMDADGLNVSQVAEKAGCHWTTVNRLYLGEVTFPRLNTCVAILNALGYKVQVTR